MLFLLLPLLLLINANWILFWRLPNSNARDAFACNLFQSLLNWEQSLYQPNYPIVLFSPASVQKLMAVFYNMSELEHMGPLARDLGLLDSHPFSHHYQYKLDEPTHFIQPYLVMDFFANDFDELGDDISVRNYFIFDGGFDIAKGFQESVRDYFNITVMAKHQPVIDNLMQEFGLNSRGLEIYSLINFHAYLTEDFYSSHQFNYGRGYFRYADSLMLGGDPSHYIKCKMLELPLITASEQGLTLLLVMPGKKVSLRQLEEKLLALNFHSFWHLANQLKYTQVSVRLPKLKFMSKINVGTLVGQMSWMRLNKPFNTEMQYQGMFESAFNRRIKLEHFVQSINMQIHAPGADHLIKPINTLEFFNVSDTFDCAEGPFLFLVRSRDVIYFMGHLRRIPFAVMASANFEQF